MIEITFKPWVMKKPLYFYQVISLQFCRLGFSIYPLVNSHSELENHHFFMGKSMNFLCAMFNSYFDITRGYHHLPIYQPINIIIPLNNTFQFAKCEFTRCYAQ